MFTFTPVSPGQYYMVEPPAGEHGLSAHLKLLSKESARSTQNNLVRQRAFSDRSSEVLKKYTSQQLTSAEEIAELVAPAPEVAELRRVAAAVKARRVGVLRRGGTGSPRLGGRANG